VWLIARDDGEGDVVLDWEKWHWAALSIGEPIVFQMIQGPECIYALPVDASYSTRSGPE
jgi:hypothetical protein